jgi:hypothetical protein
MVACNAENSKNLKEDGEQRIKKLEFEFGDVEEE